MSKATLKTRIKDELETVFGDADDIDKLNSFAQALANAIIDEIVENCKVTIESGDLTVPGTGILDSTSGACTGESTTATGTLNKVEFN